MSGKGDYVRSVFEFNCHGEKIKGVVEGLTEIPYWEHDLKVKLILGMLNTIDYKDYIHANKLGWVEQHAKEIVKAVESAFGLQVNQQLSPECKRAN